MSTLAADAVQPGVLWAATLDGLYRSSDRGGTWQAAALSGKALVSLAIDPHEPAAFFAAEATGGGTAEEPTAVWRSLDRGATWEVTPLSAVQNGTFREELRFAFDPAHPGTAYAFFVGDFATGPVFRTADRGATWTELPAALGVTGLAPSPDGILFASTGFGVARSTDQGITWEPPLPLSAETWTAPHDALTRILVSAAAPDTVWAAGAAGLWASSDGGASWAPANRGIVARDVFSLVAAPTGPSTLTALVGNGVFRSTDQGTTWTRIHGEADGPQPEQIAALDPLRPRTMYGFAADDGPTRFLVRSTDGGSTWSSLPRPFSCPDDELCIVTFFSLALAPRHPGTLFVSGLFDAPSGIGPFLLRSDDGFQTFKLLSRFAPVVLRIDPTRPSLFHGLTCNGLFQSTDGGRHWRKAGPGLLWAGAAGRGVYRWDAGLQQWTPLGEGLLPRSGYSGWLTLDPGTSTLFAVQAKKGIFRLGLERTEP